MGEPYITKSDLANAMVKSMNATLKLLKFSSASAAQRPAAETELDEAFADYKAFVESLTSTAKGESRE